jgi:hypothetical protein
LSLPPMPGPYPPLQSHPPLYKVPQQEGVTTTAAKQPPKTSSAPIFHGASSQQPQCQLRMLPQHHSKNDQACHAQMAPAAIQPPTASIPLSVHMRSMPTSQPQQANSHDELDALLGSPPSQPAAAKVGSPQLKPFIGSIEAGSP